jgi:hypothetical protein
MLKLMELITIPIDPMAHVHRALRVPAAHYECEELVSLVAVNAPEKAVE